MALSKRLEQVARMIPPCQTVADVGTDHGFLAVALIEKEIAGRVIAIDVNRGPLESAKRFVKERRLENHIECRLGDGLAITTAGEIDCAVICGMGGELMQHIISVGPELLQTYVVQPQSHREELKKFLVAQGYGITDEHCLQEGKQYYDIWVVERGVTSVYNSLPSDSILWEYGAILQERRSPIWAHHIQRRIETLESIASHMRDVSKGSHGLGAIQKEIEALRSIV